MSTTKTMAEYAKRDLYAELMVSPAASSAVIDSAHRTLMKSLHPDVAGPDSTAKAARVSEAYVILSNPTQRADYDQARKMYVATTTVPSTSGPTPSPVPSPPTYAPDHSFFVPTQFYAPHTATEPPRPEYFWTALTWFFAAFAATMAAFAATGLSVLAAVDAVVNSRRGEIGSLVDPAVWADSNLAFFAVVSSLTVALVASFVAPRAKLSAGRSFGVCLVVFFTTLGLLGLSVSPAPALVFFAAAFLTGAATFLLQTRRVH